MKSAKYHLRRVIGKTVPTLMEFITLTMQIEATMNSRPLTLLSSDYSALTPGHFLTGGPPTAVPEPDHQATSFNCLKHWQQVQALHLLQQRPKWTQKTLNLKIGDLVLIHMNIPPLTWPLARVSAVRCSRALIRTLNRNWVSH